MLCVPQENSAIRFHNSTKNSFLKTNEDGAGFFFGSNQVLGWGGPQFFPFFIGRRLQSSRSCVMTGSTDCLSFSYFSFGCLFRSKFPRLNRPSPPSAVHPLVFTGLYWVLLGFTGLYWVILGFTGFYWGYLGISRFY